MKTSEITTNINKALFKFQGIMPKIKRNATNDHFKSSYVTWDDLVDAVIPRLQECGLLFEQEEGEVDGYKTVSTRITHVESGEYKQYAPYRIKESATGNPDHNAGKSTTYAMKRSLILALGLRGTDEDTDGNDEPTCKKPQVEKITDNKTTYKVKPNLGAWTKMVEVEKLQLRRFFAIAKKKQLSDKKMKAILFYHTGKISRKLATEQELKQINDLLEESSPIEITAMIFEAAQMRQEAIAN